MTTPRDELQDFLTGNDPLNELYQQRAQPEPPEHLDQTILAAAREHARRPERPRWLVPLSVAATVVLGAGLTVRQLSSPMHSVSERAVQEAMLDRVVPTGPSVSAPLPADAAPVPRPSMDAIPSIEFEADYAPAPVTLDIEQAQRQARTRVPLPTPELGAPAPIVAPEAPQSNVASAPVTADEDSMSETVVADKKSQLHARRAAARLSRGRDSVTTEGFGGNFADRLRDNAEAAPSELTLAEPAPPARDIPAQLDEVVALLQNDRNEQAAQLLAQLRRADEALTQQMKALETVARAAPNLRASTLRRIRTLHANDQEVTARQLLDTLIGVYPDLSLPEDFPLSAPPSP